MLRLFVEVSVRGLVVASLYKYFNVIEFVDTIYTSELYLLLLTVPKEVLEASLADFSAQLWLAVFTSIKLLFCSILEFLGSIRYQFGVFELFKKFCVDVLVGGPQCQKFLKVLGFVALTTTGVYKVTSNFFMITSEASDCASKLTEDKLKRYKLKKEQEVFDIYNAQDRIDALDWVERQKAMIAKPSPLDSNASNLVTSIDIDVLD
jgi:hypothetical protein